MKIGRNAIFGIGNPTETIGSKNQRTQALRVISDAERDAAAGGDREAGERAVERQPEIEPADRRDMASVPDPARAPPTAAAAGRR